MSRDYASLSNFGGVTHGQLETIRGPQAIAETKVNRVVPSAASGSATHISKAVPAVPKDAKVGSENIVAQEDLYGVIGATPGAISDDGLSNALFTQIGFEDRLCINSREEMKDVQNRQVELERRFVELECQFQGLAEESMSRLSHIDLLQSVKVVERLGALEQREKKLVAFVNKALTSALSSGSRSQTPSQPKSRSPARNTPTSLGEGEATQDVVDLAAKIREQDDTLLLLQDQFEEMQTWFMDLSKRFGDDCKENGKAADPHAWPLETHTKGDMMELRRQVSTLQDEINQRLFELSRQVLETGQRTQMLNTQCQEFSAKVESQEVSFSTTLSRLEAADTQISLLASNLEDFMTSGQKPTAMGPGTCSSLLAVQAETIDAQKETIDVLQRQVGIPALQSNGDETIEPLLPSVEAMQVKTLFIDNMEQRDLPAAQFAPSILFNGQTLLPTQMGRILETQRGGDESTEISRRPMETLTADSDVARGRPISPPQSRLRVASPVAAVVATTIRSHSPIPISGLDRLVEAPSNRRVSGAALKVATISTPPSMDVNSSEGATASKRYDPNGVLRQLNGGLSPREVPTQASNDVDAQNARRVVYRAEIPMCLASEQVEQQTIAPIELIEKAENPFAESAPGVTMAELAPGSKTYTAPVEREKMTASADLHGELERSTEDLDLTIRRLGEKFGVHASEST